MFGYGSSWTEICSIHAIAVFPAGELSGWCRPAKRDMTGTNGGREIPDRGIRNVMFLASYMWRRIQ